MASDDREERVRNLLDRMDRSDEVKANSAKEIEKQHIEFLSRFSILKHREILPAFEYYKAINPDSFKVDYGDDRSVTLTINHRRFTGRLGFRAIPERHEIEISGVPNFGAVAVPRPPRPTYEPFYKEPGAITEGWVKDAVEKVLDDMASRA